MFLPAITVDWTGDDNPHEQRERGLLAAVVLRAIDDAATSNDVVTTLDAMDFLLTRRCHPYLELIGIDPDEFKEALRRTMNRECVAGRAGVRATENRKRRRLRLAWTLYHDHRVGGSAQPLHHWVKQRSQS